MQTRALQPKRACRAPACKLRPMAETEVVIARRFCGPPNSGNGGYCAGLLAERIAGAAEVTLRSPPPLERPLQLAYEQSSAALRSGEQLIADARATSLELEAPRPPSFAAAQACVARFAGWKTHVFPRCFVCGTERAEGDGLRIFPGATDEGDAVAAPFVPDQSLADPATGRLQLAHAWAALDCPGYFAAAAGEEAVLGRISVQLTRLPAIGEQCVVVGWALGREGRKISAATALYDQAGELLGCARQTWIALRAQG